MFYGIHELISKQPYYNKHLNHFRAGMWTMILGMTIVDLFASVFGKGKSFFSIVLFVVGVCSFFGGIVLSRYTFKKHVEGIYKRFKDKKIEYKKKSRWEKGIDHSNSSVSEESQENEIESSNEENKADELSSNSENEGEDSDSDRNSMVLSDRISERITSFGSLDEICKIKKIYYYYYFLFFIFYIIFIIYIFIYLYLFIY